MMAMMNVFDYNVDDATSTKRTLHVKKNHPDIQKQRNLRKTNLDFFAESSFLKKLRLSLQTPAPERVKHHGTNLFGRTS